MAQEQALSLVLFSGTDDKLTAASVLAVGAAVMARPVHIFLQYYALDAFRLDSVLTPHYLSPEATPAQAALVHAHVGQHWSELLFQAKEVGTVTIQACALSMDMFHLTLKDLSPLVDGVEGVAAFMAASEQGQVVFI